jgi:hypothetical protein
MKPLKTPPSTKRWTLLIKRTFSPRLSWRKGMKFGTGKSLSGSAKASSRSSRRVFVSEPSTVSAGIELPASWPL